MNYELCYNWFCPYDALTALLVTFMPGNFSFCCLLELVRILPKF